MKSHLEKFHEGAEERHRSLGSMHESLSDAYGAMVEKADVGDYYSTIARLHREAADEHRGYAREHADLARALGEMPDVSPLEDRGGSFHHPQDLDGPRGKAMVPSNVKGVLPDVPQGVRLIGRHGGPPVEADGADGLDEETKSIIGL